jgi:hypothetical protein
MIEIKINRKQDYTQSTSAYVGYFAEGISVGTESTSSAISQELTIQSPVIRITYQYEGPEMAAWHAKIDDFKKLERGWDGYIAPPPSEIAIRTAQNFVSSLAREKSEPSRIAPSVIGGVGITGRHLGKRVYIEIYNDGQVYALFSDGESDPLTQHVQPGHQSFKLLINKMRDYLDG